MVDTYNGTNLDGGVVWGWSSVGSGGVTTGPGSRVYTLILCVLLARVRSTPVCLGVREEIALGGLVTSFMAVGVHGYSFR